MMEIRVPLCIPMLLRRARETQGQASCPCVSQTQDGYHWLLLRLIVKTGLNYPVRGIRWLQQQQ